jgi:short chain dehydrogenase
MRSQSHSSIIQNYSLHWQHKFFLQHNIIAFDQRSTGEEVAKAYISRSEGKTCSFFPIHLLNHLLLTYPLVVITGTSQGGIGAATATALAYGKPRALFVTGRNASKTEPVIKEIQKIDANVKTIFINLDLSNQESVRQAAKTILESGEAEKIHGLINNAGIMNVWIPGLLISFVLSPKFYSRNMR